MPSDAPEYPSRQACNYPHLWPAQGRLDLRLRAMLEPGKITPSGGTSKGSAQKDTLRREASKALIRQGKMWVIAGWDRADGDDLARVDAGRVDVEGLDRPDDGAAVE